VAKIAKNGLSVEHPIPGDELSVIKRHLKARAAEFRGCAIPAYINDRVSQ